MLSKTEYCMFHCLMAPWRFDKFMHDIEFMDGLPVIEIETTEEAAEDLECDCE